MRKRFSEKRFRKSVQQDKPALLLPADVIVLQDIVYVWTFLLIYKGEDSMQYRENFMPITCGAYNSMPIPRPFQTTQQVMPQQGSQLPSLPTGVPLGTPSATAVPTAPQSVPGFTQAPGSFTMSPEQLPVTVSSTLYTPGFLRTQIGKRMRVEFLIGTSNLTDRSGTLVAVGASYIIIRLIDSDDLMLCDLYSIKFVTIFM
jgi:hypothetical protein